MAILTVFRRGLLLILLFLATFHSLSACPFCPTLKPTLSQQRDESDWLVFAEVASAPDVEKKSTNSATEFTVHKILKQPKAAKQEAKISVANAPALKAGQFAMLFGNRGEEKGAIEWTAVQISELGAGYVAQMPDLKRPTPERLQFYARYLESDDPSLAEDAIQEFGHADLADVRAILQSLDLAAMRAWLADENVRPEHKGFYGVTLGLAVAEQEKQDATEKVPARGPFIMQEDLKGRGNALGPRKTIIGPGESKQIKQLLKKLISTTGSDFRAGYDGILAGYLLAHGEQGIDTLKSRILKNEKAPIGDVLHLAKALRFYYEECPPVLREKTSDAVTHLLTWSQCAAGAATDLARWKNWTALDTVVSLYHDKQDDIGIKRAVVVYLKACPLEKASTALETLRTRDPKGVAKAESWDKVLQPAK